MKLFLRYLADRKRPLAFAAAAALLLAGLFALYRLPWPPFLYALTLALVLGGGAMAVDFSRVKKKHEALTQTAVPLTEALPPEDGLLPEDYRALIDRLLEDARRRETEAAGRAEAMQDYFTVWAHQIKTPIASMRLTLQGEDSDTARRALNDLRRVEEYADMVMTYLRLESASTDYVIRSCGLDSILRPVVRSFAGDFIAKHLRLSYEPLNVSVLTDEKWLAFVLGQVLSNALKYTEKGGITITLESPRTLVIADTGMGIAPEDLPRIFENGFTGFNGRADKRASGIGLYLCRRVCTALGHSISAESKVGEGTRIMIDLSAQNLGIE